MRSGTAVARDLFGIKPPPVASIARTAWLAVAHPHQLTRRWIDGERQGMTSPIAMMSIVTAIAAFVAVVLTNFTGNDAPSKEDLAATSSVLDAAPFLSGWFPQRFQAAQLQAQDFGEQFRQVGSWLVAFWPLLFLGPGLLVLAPWRSISRHDALILVCVETIFIMMLAGVFSVLRIAAPGLTGGWLSFVIWCGLVAHSARHIRLAIPERSVAYAISRPVLATLVFPLVVYVWTIGVVALALMLGRP